MPGNKPTHELKVKDLETDDTATIGVAWHNAETGSFGVKLHPCTTLTYESLKGKVLTLFPVRTEEEWAEYHRNKRGKKKAPEE